jgi:hypothetical protein
MSEISPINTENDKLPIDDQPNNATNITPVIAPLDQSIKQEASTAKAPKVPDVEKTNARRKTYEFLDIDPIDSLNVFNKVNKNEWSSADPSRRDEIASERLNELNQNLIAADPSTPSGRVEIPSLRKIIVDGKETEELVNVPASDSSGRLSKAGQDYYNQSSSLLSSAAKDEKGGLRINPLTGKTVSKIGSRLLTPYAKDEIDPERFSVNEEGIKYEKLNPEDVVDYAHVRRIYQARAKQAGISYKKLITELISPGESLDQLDVNRRIVSDIGYNAGTYEDGSSGEFVNDLELLAQIKNSKIGSENKEENEKLQAILTKSIARLKAEEGMGSKLVDLHDGQPIFNMEKIKNINDIEQALEQLPISKTEKQSLKLNFKTNFESQAVELIRKLDVGDQMTDLFRNNDGLEKLADYIDPETRKKLDIPDFRDFSSFESFTNSGLSAYDWLKQNSDLYDTNIISSSIEKILLGTLDSFDSTRVAVLSLGAGIAQAGMSVLPNTISEGLKGRELLEDARLGLAEGKAFFSEMKKGRAAQLGKWDLIGNEDSYINITSDDIFDAAGNIIEMYLTLGTSSAVKGLGLIGSRTLTVAASKELGKKAAVESTKMAAKLQGADSLLLRNIGKISKSGIEFKEGAKALWQNAEALNTAANVLKTSLYGSFTSAGGGIGEGYSRAIQAGKSEDEALIEATSTGLSNGLATFVAMTVMNGLFPSLGVEKGLIKASEGVGLRTSIRNTIARNKSSDSISKGLRELVKDKATLKGVPKGVADAMRGISKSQGIVGFGKSVTFGSIAEGIEEWGDEMLAPVINAYLLKNESARKQLETDGYWLGALKAGVIGMLMGGATSLGTKTSEGKAKAFELANQRMDSYIERVLPAYKGMQDELVSVKSTTAEGAEAIGTLRNILETGTTDQKVQALTELGKQKIQQLSFDANTKQEGVLKTPSTPQDSDTSKNPDAKGDPITPKEKTTTVIEKKKFDIPSKITNKQNNVNVPVQEESNLASFAYNQAHGLEIKDTNMPSPKLEVSGSSVFQKVGGNITVTSYNINGNEADLHSFEDTNGDTIFTNKTNLGKLLLKSHGQGVVLKNLSKVSNTDNVASLIKSSESNVDKNQTPEKDKASDPEVTEKDDSNKSTSEQDPLSTDTAPIEAEEKTEDIYDENKQVVGENKLKPALKKVYDKYRNYFNRKKIGIIIVTNASELENIPEFKNFKKTSMGFAGTINIGKSNQRDVIVIITDNIESQKASTPEASIETIFEDILEHENAHVITKRFNRTKKGNKLRKDFEEDLFNNQKLNEAMDEDYPSFSKQSNDTKFFEFVRTFVSGKLTNRTLSAMMSISPSMKKWIAGFIKFAKKELKNYRGAKTYLSAFEKFYIQEIKDDAALFKYSPSSTEAFKNFITNLISKVSPTKARKQGKLLTTKEIDFSNVDRYADAFTDFLRTGITDLTSPNDLVSKLVDILNGFSEESIGLGPESKKEIFNKVIEDWRNNETNTDILNALLDASNKIGSVDNAPHISDESTPASEMVLKATEERLAYNQYTRIRKTVADTLVVLVKNDTTATQKAVTEIDKPSDTQGNSASNAYILGRIDQATGEIIDLGFEVGDVVSVVNSSGDVIQHLVYVKSEIFIAPNGQKEARHEFLSGVVSENGKLSSFGIGLQTMFSDKFRKDFEESGLVDDMFAVESGNLKLDNVDKLLQFVFESLTNKAINSEGKNINSIEIAGKSYTFNDLFLFDITGKTSDANASPFYYKDGKIVVNIDALRTEFSFINDSLLKDSDNKKTIGLLIAQAVRTAIDEELLHHITTLTFGEDELVSLYNDLAENDRFSGLLNQIANAQGIYVSSEQFTDQQRYVIATEFLAFINQKSFDGATYADQYNQLLKSYASAKPDGKALATASLYGKRFKDILIARSATSLMAPRLIDMVNKLSVLKSEVMPKQSSSNMANVYANFNADAYTKSRGRMQQSIDNAFLKQYSAVNDLRTYLAESRLMANQILDFDFNNNTVSLSPEFRAVYQNKITAEELAELDDYFSRLNNDSVVREFLVTLSAARASLDAITEQVDVNNNDPDLGNRFQQATKNYNNLVLDYADIFLNKNLTKVDEFGRSFAVIGSELGGESFPVYSETSDNSVTVKFNADTSNVTIFTYDVNLFGYENQNPSNAINDRYEQRKKFADVNNDLEKAKTETLWFYGYRGRYTSSDRQNFPNKVSTIEGNAAFLGEEEFNFFYISRINGESFRLNNNPYSYTDFRKMMGFNPIDFKINSDGEKVFLNFNEVINKFIISDEELETGVSNTSTGESYTVTIRRMSESKLLKDSEPERQRIVLGSALQRFFGDTKNILTWFNKLEEIIGYERSSGDINVINEISGRETFASKFAKQLKYRMFNNRLIHGNGIHEKIDGETESDQSLYGMIKELQSAYYALFASITPPSDVKLFKSVGKNELSNAEVSNLLAKLPVFLEAIDSLNQDIGLARKAYTRFTSSYLLNTIKGDIRLIQEQNTEGLRANEELLRAIQYSFYDIQAMEDVEFLMDYRNNGGRNGINGIIALNLLDQLANIPSSAQNEYYVSNTPSKNVAYLLQTYAMYLENGVNPRTKDADGKSTYPTDNLVFNVIQKYGDKANENEDDFNADIDTKPSDTAETIGMSGVSPVTGRDEASQEAIDSARRESMHEEVKRMKSWTFHAAISIFQRIVGNDNDITIDGIDTSKTKLFFYLFAKIQNRPSMENDFNEEDFSQLKKDHQDLSNLMLDQLKALSNHYNMTNSPNTGFEQIANKVRKSSYTHPMEFLADVVEVIGAMERDYLDEVTDAGKTLAEYSQRELKKEIAKSESAVSVDKGATSFADTSKLQEKLESLIEGLNLELDSPSVSPSIIALYKTKISEIESEIESATQGAAQQVQGQSAVKRYIKKDTTELRQKLDFLNSQLDAFKTSLLEIRADNPKNPSIPGVMKEISNKQAEVKRATYELKNLTSENEKADAQIKTPIEKLENYYQALRSKLYAAQQKATTDDLGNAVSETTKRDIGNEGQFLRRPRVGETENIAVNELAADAQIESIMNRVGLMISKLQNLQEKPKSMLSYNQEQAQLVLDSMQEDSDKNKLSAGTIFYARTFKFKSNESLINDSLFMKFPLFSALIQSMPNLIVYQPDTNYNGKTNNLPDGAGLVQLSNGDNILYITNPDQLNNSKQAQILESLIVAQIKSESDNGARPSVLQQTIDQMAEVVQTQAKHAINMTPDRINVMMARAELAINKLTTIDNKVKKAIISRYKKSLEANAYDSIKLLTNRTARRSYIEDRVSNRTENVSRFFDQLVTADRANGKTSTIDNIQMIVDMFTNPDSYRLLSTFKSPDLDFNAYSPLPQFDALLNKALSIFAIPEVRSSAIHEIQIQKRLQLIDEANEGIEEDNVETDPNLIYEAIAENYNEENRTRKKLSKPEILNIIKQMSDSQIKGIIDPLIMERYFLTNRSPEAAKDLVEAFKQNTAQPDFLYRYVGSQLMKAMEPTLINADPSIKETSIFDNEFPTKSLSREARAYDVLFATNKPILLSTMMDPAIGTNNTFSNVEARTPTGDITNFYYGHSPMTETYRVNRKKVLLGMLLGKTETGKSLVDKLFDDQEELAMEVFSVTSSVSLDKFSGILGLMIKELPALIGDDVVARAEQIVDRIAVLARNNKEETKKRIAELSNQLEVIKQQGREFLLEKLIERNKEAAKVATSQLLFTPDENEENIGIYDSRSTLESIANRISNYLISEKLGLNRNSYNLAKKLETNANSYLLKYKNAISRISNYDQQIATLFDGDFSSDYTRNNTKYRFLVDGRNNLIDKAEIYKSEYVKLAAMDLMGELINPSHFFASPNSDVQGYIRSRLNEIGNYGKIKYRSVSPFDEDATSSAVFRGISGSLVTRGRKTNLMLGINKATRPEFASELLDGITKNEAKEMFASLGPDLLKNFANNKGYLQDNFKSEMVREFFSRLKQEGTISKFAKEMSQKIDVLKYNESQIKEMVIKSLSENKSLLKLINDEFIVTDLELAESDVETGKKILDGNIEGKIEEITSEIERLTKIRNTTQGHSTQLSKTGSPKIGNVTLFEIPAYKYPDENDARKRMNMGMPASRKVNLRLTRSLNESDLSTDQIARFDATTRDARIINEAMNIFLEEEGEVAYKALSEEVDLYGEGFDVKQNIQNVIELIQLKNNLSEKTNTKFELMIQEMSKIDTILNEADQPAIELYGMTLRDMIKLGLSPATLINEKGKKEVINIADKSSTQSEINRIKQTALFIKNEAGLAVFMPTDGKLVDQPGRSHFLYSRSALNHLQSFKKITKQKGKAESLLKDAIFRASRGATGFDTFLRTQSHENVDFDASKPVSSELAVATGVNPAMTKGEFVKTAKRLFNEYFLKEIGNYVFSSFAKGIGIYSTIKKTDRMNDQEIQEAFDSVYSFASDVANDAILKSSGFSVLTKAKQDYTNNEKAKIVKSAYDIAINENKFLAPNSHASNNILLNESMFEDIITMLESDKFALLNKNKSVSAYEVAAINAIASVFSNEINTANSTSGKFFSFDTAITRLDLRQNYSRLYSLLYSQDIFTDLLSGVVDSEKRDSNDLFTHSNALVKQKFARSFGSYQRALSLQGLIEQGINGNSGRNKYSAKYEEYQDRIGKAASQIGNDFDLGSRAYMVAVTKGIVEANNRDGGTDLDLALKLHYFASAYNNGIRDHRQLLRDIKDFKKNGNMFSRAVKLFDTIGRKQSREDMNVSLINNLIGAEIELIARRDPKSLTRQEVQSYINQIENILYDGFDSKTISGMNNYANALLEEFTGIYEGHRIANAFASEETLRGIEEVVDPKISKTAKTLKNPYSVIPLRFGHVKNPLSKKDPSIGNGSPTIDSFVNFEQSLMNYKGRTIYDLQKESFVRVLRPLDMNPFTAPDQIANDAIYRMYLNPSYTVIRKMLGEYGVDVNGIPKTENGHLVGAIKALYNISNDQRIEKIGQYNQISAYIIDKINTEIKNDMPMDLADSLLADALRISNVHLMVKTLASVTQILTQGILPALAKYLNVKIGNFAGLHQKDSARLTEAYALALKDYFKSSSEGDGRNFVKENSTNSYKWRAEGANKRDSQVSMTKYASQNHLTYLTRVFGASFNKLGEGLLDATIGKPERALVQAIYMFELFNELQKDMGQNAPKTIAEMIKMNPDQFSTYAKTKADTMVTDFMGIGDRAKKARIYNLPRNRAVETLLLNYVTRYGNHALTVGPNLMVNMDQLYKQLSGTYSDKQMRNDALENVIGTVLQTLLFRFGQVQVMLPNLIYLFYGITGLLGGDKDEDEEDATQKTLDLLRRLDVYGEPELEEDTFMTILSRRLRTYLLPQQFAATKKENRTAKLFGWQFKHSPILESNLGALRKSALDTLPVISYLKAGSALSVPLGNNFIDLTSEISMMGLRGDNVDFSDIGRIAFKTENIASAPVLSLLESYKGVMNTASVPLNYFLPKEGMEGISATEMLEGMLVSPLGTREYRPTYYERIKNKGGWGDY